MQQAYQLRCMAANGKLLLLEGGVLHEPQAGSSSARSSPSPPPFTSHLVLVLAHRRGNLRRCEEHEEAGQEGAEGDGQAAHADCAEQLLAKLPHHGCVDDANRRLQQHAGQGGQGDSGDLCIVPCVCQLPLYAAA